MAQIQIWVRERTRERRAMGLLQWCLLLLLVVWVARVEGRMGMGMRVLLSAKHRFKEDENVPLFANKVGPFHNPRCVVIVCGF